jgi:hypothetical protein
MFLYYPKIQMNLQHPFDLKIQSYPMFLKFLKFPKNQCYLKIQKIQKIL